MTATKRLSRELADVQALSNSQSDGMFSNIHNPGENLYIWEGFLHCTEPHTAPNKGIK